MSNFIRPTNQKGVYHNFAIVLEKLENGDITVEKAEAMTNALIELQMINLALKPHYCKTLVMGSTGINNEF